jgi:hypothetical protein
LKTSIHTIFTLLAAAGLLLLAASGVSCGKAAVEVVPPSPDTLALVEGLHLFETEEYELARKQLAVSALSTSTYIRSESYLYLNALEMELGNYEIARTHLERYHTETRRLLLSAAAASQRMEEEATQLRKLYNLLGGGLVLLALLVGGVVVFLVRRGRATKEAKGDINLTEVTSNPDIYDWSRYLTDAEAFKQTEIWNEIVSLGAQKPGREARVLSLTRQEVLDEELSRQFSDFAAHLQADCPALTAGDVKLCCLSLLPLSTFARSLCFGSVESNIIKQRKHTIKKKLCSDTRGSALFEFIFETRV